MSGGACPFPGLLPFQEEDAPYFFGRERETAELLKRLEESRFLAVIGVSGSGKSSLVRAGVKPELRFGSQPWRIVEMKPGAGPGRRLREALGKDVAAHSYGVVDALRDSPQKTLLFVDQFEEIFSYRTQGSSQAEEADLFVQQLLRAANEPGLPLYVLLTMRTDYLGQCALFRNLPEALNDGAYLVPRLVRQEQEEAIRSPLSVSGVDIEPGVVDSLLNAAEANRDELPVLQHLLKRLWEGWEARGAKGPITRADYDHTGGWQESVARDAEAVMQPLTPPEQKAVRRIYQRITRKGVGERPIRTPCPLETLSGLTEGLVPPERLREILKAFRKRDLLVWEGELDKDSRIDIPHECMTWRWANLAEWIEDEDRDWQRLDFIDRSRIAGTPLAGAALVEAQRLRERIVPAWAGRYKLSAMELRGWIGHSADVERFRRRWRIGAAAIVVLAAFVALWLWAWGTKSAAQGKIEMALQSASRSELLFDLEPASVERATLLATQSMRQSPTFDGDRTLRRELNLLPKTKWISKQGGTVRVLAFSPEGQWLATGSDDGTAQVLSVPTGKEVSSVKKLRAVNALAFSPDGKWLALGSADKTARLMEAATGREVARLEARDPVTAVAFSRDGKWFAAGDGAGAVSVLAVGSSAGPLKKVWGVEHLGQVNSLAFSPDSKRLASGSNDGTARVLDAATGREISRLRHDDWVNSVAFSPDGKFLATASADHTARAMEASTGKIGWSQIHQGAVNSVAFSPDGFWVATGSWDGAARLLGAGAGKETWRLTHQGPVNCVTFSPHGKWLATASDDGSARVLEVATGREVLRLGHDNTVKVVAFSPKDGSVATGSEDSTARLMETPDDKDGSRLANPNAAIAFAFSRDAGRVAIGGLDGSTRSLDTATGKEFKTLPQHGQVNAIALSPDGAWAATTNDDGRVRLMETATAKELWWRPLKEAVWSLTFSPDGKMLAMGSQDKTASVLVAATGQALWDDVLPGEVSTLAFSADSRRLLAASSDGTALILDAASGKELSRPLYQAPVRAAEFSPDGKWLAVGSQDKTARVIEVAKGKEVLRLALKGSVIALAFSPDSKKLASGIDDKSVRIVDTQTGEELFRTELPGVPRSVHFSEDRMWLEVVHDASYGFDLIYRRFPLDPKELIRQACGRVNRDLTTEEWKQYIGPHAPYQHTCEVSAQR